MPWGRVAHACASARHRSIGATSPTSIRHAGASLGYHCVHHVRASLTCASLQGTARAYSALRARSHSGNDPAGKALPRVATRLRLLIIRLAMNDHGRTPVVEERVSTRPERDERGIGDQDTCTIGSDQQIRQIARMAPLRVL